MSTEQMVGLNGQSYSGTMSAMAWEVTAPLALIMLALSFTEVSQFRSHDDTRLS
ncbi:hypothetical protein PO124_03225 [Bacillus licheniformis]|nr:hypothetical protein [Bacillus licheniformis]